MADHQAKFLRGFLDVLDAHLNAKQKQAIAAESKSSCTVYVAACTTLLYKHS